MVRENAVIKLPDNAGAPGARVFFLPVFAPTYLPPLQIGVCGVALWRLPSARVGRQVAEGPASCELLV